MSEYIEFNREVGLAVLTISDTRTAKTDESGALIELLVKQSPFIHIAEKQICKDEKSDILQIIMSWYSNPKINCIITTGGTGIAKRDITIEAIAPTFTKEIDGFGELFRYLSFTEDVGTRAMLSRAAAGTFLNKVIFILPGSPKAIQLAMSKLILPELEHIVFELTK
ncbi:molybdenum cofactor biosynthesis protein B [Ureibacillus xyleni]|uniref:Molybdenum cofactor biosynthesis protein B n=1 Tax=Ureibacillus xyleni TaxID=614648 RepID=A0A285S4I2_9BACL|nr:MogA/MoaB family molybdenum cofactor biosynthesis protein [Ureibacillus xyleni]SOB99824.1 molybdenum cofactor biosynthesis protein B [Ureibacillus xyleni]